MTTPPPYLMLVDDDPDDRDLLMEAFNSHYLPVPVKYATGARELMAYLDQCPKEDLPAVILLDYQMPEINGREILELMQRNTRYKHLVKVMWSSSQRTKDREDCKKLGAVDYLVKPSSDADLRRIVHQLTAVFDFATRSK